MNCCCLDDEVINLDLVIYANPVTKTESGQPTDTIWKIQFVFSESHSKVLGRFETKALAQIQIKEYMGWGNKALLG